jgi:phosphoadenosine phosphosulfate reductase
MTDAAVDIAAASRALEGASAVEILRWATGQLAPRLTFATGFGAEGCVLIDLIAKHALPIDLFTLDTGVLFPETYALWKQLETRYGVTIRAVRPAPADVSDGLWTTEPDRCCELRKVTPLTRELASFSGWITAIRRDQTPERATAQIVETDRRFGLLKINPLVTWTHDDVWAHLYANDVPYNPLHEQGYPSIGCQPCTSAIVPGENLRAGRWRGAGKRECGLHVPPEFDSQGLAVPDRATPPKGGVEVK